MLLTFFKSFSEHVKFCVEFRQRDMVLFSPLFPTTTTNSPRLSFSVPCCVGISIDFLRRHTGGCRDVVIFPTAWLTCDTHHIKRHSRWGDCQQSQAGITEHKLYFKNNVISQEGINPAHSRSLFPHIYHRFYVTARQPTQRIYGTPCIGNDLFYRTG